MLSCSMLTARAEGKHVVTLEGMQEEAKEFGDFLAGEGAEQCGFWTWIYHERICYVKGAENPSEAEINEYLAGSLCRCSGFMGQTRSILKFLEAKKEGGGKE